jgi:hypothetical protein
MLSTRDCRTRGLARFIFLLENDAMIGFPMTSALLLAIFPLAIFPGCRVDKA